MTDTNGMADFYEDDEPVGDVVAAYQQGSKGTTAAPSGMQALPSANFQSFVPAVTPSRSIRDQARMGHLVQA